MLLQPPTGRDDSAGIDNGTGFMRAARASPGMAKPITDCVQCWKESWCGAVGIAVPDAAEADQGGSGCEPQPEVPEIPGNSKICRKEGAFQQEPVRGADAEKTRRSGGVRLDPD